ncbi:MaoC family dehydratase [Streptomyces sp. NPDC048045]|uniref:MaoC family dehydratase n=1 Tax=Streptomyces sp. NPDC048045 TaxID=3154710 RepID=UPI003438C162
MGSEKRSGRPEAGTELPPLEIPVTRTLIVAGAIASRDYQDVHHDAELARQKGSPDIFMNILTTNGLVGRYITDHFGPAAILRRVAIRLGAPNYPGDTMVLTGRIEEVDGDTATVRVIGANALGRHVTGTVTVSVPAPAGTSGSGPAPAGTSGTGPAPARTPASAPAPAPIPGSAPDQTPASAPGPGREAAS